MPWKNCGDAKQFNRYQPGDLHERGGGENSGVMTTAPDAADSGHMKRDGSTR